LEGHYFFHTPVSLDETGVSIGHVRIFYQLRFGLLIVISLDEAFPTGKKHKSFMSVCQGVIVGESILAL